SMPMLQAAQYQPLWDEFVPGEKTISRAELTPADWIGTGPWQIVSIEEGRVTLARFDDYRDEQAYADSLVLIVEDDPAVRLNGWKAGDVDVLPITAQQAQEVWTDRGNLFVAPSSTATFAAFNF